MSTFILRYLNPSLCDELITRQEKAYRLCCVVVCDLETSRMRMPCPALGRSATGRNLNPSGRFINTHRGFRSWLNKFVVFPNPQKDFGNYYRCFWSFYILIEVLSILEHTDVSILVRISRQSLMSYKPLCICSLYRFRTLVEICESVWFSQSCFETLWIQFTSFIYPCSELC